MTYESILLSVGVRAAAITFNPPGRDWMVPAVMNDLVDAYSAWDEESATRTPVATVSGRLSDDCFELRVDRARLAGWFYLDRAAPKESR